MPVAQLDLTPFGFTPTESLAYRALTDVGPQTGYGLARALSIARANVYQALRGLVAKGAVTTTEERPERYRPLQPAALVALIAKREAGKLDRLEGPRSHAHGGRATRLRAGSGDPPRQAPHEPRSRLAQTCGRPDGDTSLVLGGGPRCASSRGAFRPDRHRHLGALLHGSYPAPGCPW